MSDGDPPLGGYDDDDGGAAYGDNGGVDDGGDVNNDGAANNGDNDINDDAPYQYFGNNNNDDDDNINNGNDNDNGEYDLDGLGDALAQIDADDAFDSLPPFANEENRQLDELVKQKERTLADLTFVVRVLLFVTMFIRVFFCAAPSIARVLSCDNVHCVVVLCTLRERLYHAIHMRRLHTTYSAGVGGKQGACGH
jgi:hypothetical protein